MKLSKLIMFCAIVYAPVSMAGFELYDDFNGSSIDTSLWDIDDSSAAISLTGSGLARFDHNSAVFDDSAWLIAKQDVANIKGIKAKMFLSNDCIGDNRVRVGAAIGERGSDYLFAQNGLRTGEIGDELINSGVSVLETATDDYKHDLLWGAHPGFGDTDISGKWVTLTMLFDKSHKIRMWNYFDGQTDGEIQKRYAPSLSPMVDPFVGVGTRSGDNGATGLGTCTAWFDWVRVFKE